MAWVLLREECPSGVVGWDESGEAYAWAHVFSSKANALTFVEHEMGALLWDISHDGFQQAISNHSHRPCRLTLYLQTVDADMPRADKEATDGTDDGRAGS